MPKANSYPKCLQEFYKRDIWEATLLDAKRDYLDNANYFIKPRYEFKTFTGFNIQGTTDNNKDINKITNKYKHKYPIYCSELIKIISEYRVYVANNKILEIVHYWDNEIYDKNIIKNAKINEKIVKRAVQTLSNSDENLDGYAIDFAIIENGDTVLLELNKGFSIDSYTASDETYYKVIKSRWDELINKSLKK